MALLPHGPVQPLQVRIATTAGSVHVTGDDRAEVAVEPGAEMAFTKDGVVEIRPRRPSSAVTVHCPAGANLVVGTASGSVELQGRLGSVSITSASGSIRVAAVADADLRTASGAVEVGDCVQACRVSTKSGRVTVDDTGSADVSTVSGTVRIERVTGEVVAYTVSGGVTIMADGPGPVRARTVSGGVTVLLPAGTKPTIRVSGRGLVESACEAGDDVIVDVTTVSGTVEVVPC